MNDKELAELARAIRASEEAARLRRADDLTLHMLRKILGEECPTDPASFQPSLAEKLLDDKRWDKRLAALVIVASYCKDACRGDPALVKRIIHLSAHDASGQVRGVAMHTIGKLMESSRHVETGKYLCGVARDTSLPLETRASAYIGLCTLHGVDPPIVHETQALIDQMDCSILRYYCGEGKEGQKGTF